MEGLIIPLVYGGLLAILVLAVKKGSSFLVAGEAPRQLEARGSSWERAAQKLGLDAKTTFGSLYISGRVEGRRVSAELHALASGSLVRVSVPSRGAPVGPVIHVDPDDPLATLGLGEVWLSEGRDGLRLNSRGAQPLAERAQAVWRSERTQLDPEDPYRFNNLQPPSIKDDTWTIRLGAQPDALSVDLVCPDPEELGQLIALAARLTTRLEDGSAEHWTRIAKQHGYRALERPGTKVPDLVKATETMHLRASDSTSGTRITASYSAPSALGRFRLLNKARRDDLDVPRTLGNLVADTILALDAERPERIAQAMHDAELLGQVLELLGEWPQSEVTHERVELETDAHLRDELPSAMERVHAIAEAIAAVSVD